MKTIESVTGVYENALNSLLDCSGDEIDRDERDFIAAALLSRAFASLIERTAPANRQTVCQYIELRVGAILAKTLADEPSGDACAVL